MASTLTKKKYEESQKVKDAFDKYNQYKDTQNPGEYIFSDAELLSKTESELFNKEDFSYSAENDPVYLEYKKLYTEQGKQAMEDSVGNASALTGGYGNTYAQTAGQKAYDSYLGKLNAVIPELYTAAYSRYQDELDRIESKLGYLTDKNKDEYSRYLDRYTAYTDEVDALRNLYLQEYKNDMSIQDSEWESAYKIAMAEQEKAIANAEIGYKYYAANLNQKQFEDELAYKKEAAAKESEYLYNKLKQEQTDSRRENDRFWAEYDERNRETIREDEIYSILGNTGEYEAICALDLNYEDDETVRYKALSMGIDKEFVDAYFDAKY